MALPSLSVRRVTKAGLDLSSQRAWFSSIVMLGRGALSRILKVFNQTKLAKLNRRLNSTKDNCDDSFRG